MIIAFKDQGEKFEEMKDKRFKLKRTLGAGKQTTKNRHINTREMRTFCFVMKLRKRHLSRGQQAGLNNP